MIYDNSQCSPDNLVNVVKIVDIIWKKLKNSNVNVMWKEWAYGMELSEVLMPENFHWNKIYNENDDKLDCRE